MKKVLAIFTFMLAFAAGANAQDKKMSAEESAKLDAIEIAKELNLGETQQADFQRLFQMKHEVMSNPDMSLERKTVMAQQVDLKLRASLTPAQIEKLEKKPELMAKLTGSSQVKAANAAKK